MFKEFPNIKLEHLRCFKKAGLIAAFGFRSCLILNDDLEVKCRFLDANRNERFYCGEFYESKGCDRDCETNTEEMDSCIQNSGSKYFFVIGGESGIIKILDLCEGMLFTFLKGHTGSIRDIKIFEDYVISAGEDSSIRVWSLKTLECVSVCAGLFGHKDHILSIDILHDNSLIVSSGTDCSIKQWNISKTDPLVYQPFTTFNAIHRCPISKVKYYGDMILSLCNSHVSMIYNNRKDIGFGMDRNDPVLLGCIEVFNNCKTFTVLDHVFIGMSASGDVYLFDLRNIITEKSPFLVSTGVSTVEDFVEMSEVLYISTGNRIHKVKIDFTHFMVD